MPITIFAQTNFTGNLKTLIDDFTDNVVGALGTLFLALGVVAFFFGMFQFILASRDGDEKKIKNGKQFMLWSVISLFVMFSIYGIIRFTQQNLQLPDSDQINIPRLNFGRGNNNNNNNNNNCGPNGATCQSEGRPGTCQSGSCVPNGSVGQCTNRPVGYPCIIEGEGVEGVCSGAGRCVYDTGQEG